MTQGVDPWAYLHDVLERIPTHPNRGRAELLPRHRKAAQTTTPSSTCGILAATVARSPPRRRRTYLQEVSTSRQPYRYVVTVTLAAAASADP